MKALLPLLLAAAVACGGAKEDRPVQNQGTGTMSPAAQDSAAVEHPPAARDTALTGTFGGGAAGKAPGTPAETATHPGATGTDAASPADPNGTTSAAPPAPKSTT